MHLRGLVAFRSRIRAESHLLYLEVRSGFQQQDVRQAAHGIVVAYAHHSHSTIQCQLLPRTNEIRVYRRRYELGKIGEPNILQASSGKPQVHRSGLQVELTPERCRHFP